MSDGLVVMDNLNLAGLRDKISSKLGGASKGKKDAKSKKSASKSEKKVKKNGVVDEVLRKEAMALGASETDLALIDTVEEEGSEQEFEDTGVVDKKFAGDLQRYMKELGIEKENGAEDAEEEDDEQEEEEEEDEIVDESSEAEEEDENEEEDESSIPESKNDSKKDSKKDSKEETKVDHKKDSKTGSKSETKNQSSDKITNLSSVQSSNLAIPNRQDWYNTPVPTHQESENLDRFGRERCLDRGKSTVEQDAKTYLAEFASRDSQRKFLSQILSDGTLNDKISALTLLVQESPIHNTKALDTLVSYCGKKSRTAALQAINALKDLLISGVLPDRKLVAFAKQPLRRDSSDVQLAVWWFEDHLKTQYFQLVSVLEHLTHDPIVHVRTSVLSHIFELLTSKPEQEANLLRLGVNKLGDSDNKVAAKTSHLILQLEQAHPAMKKIITDAVVDVLLRPNADYHAIYYSVLTLNQTILTRKDPQLANLLVKTYFVLFEKILKLSDQFNSEKKPDGFVGQSQKGRKNNRKNFKKGKKGGRSVKPTEKSDAEVVEEKNTRLFSAILTGLNRAFPFLDLPSSVYELHLDTLFKITHLTNFNTSVQALMLVHHVVSTQKLEPGRFYRTLYESLLDPRLALLSKQGIYLNLLFKALKDDSDKARVLAFAKRMLQISAHWMNVGSIAGMIFLLSQLSKSVPEIRDLCIEKAPRPDPQDENGVNDEPKNEDYDGKKRDPQYANAHTSSLWEIGTFVAHYHPTVSVYAASLLSGEEQPKPDLGLFTLAHFLDRFVYKNAKEKPAARGSSIMQPLGGAHTGSLLVNATNSSGSIPANTENWLNKKVSDIRPDERFFFDYFTSKQNKVKEGVSGKKPGFDDEEDNDEEIWQALVNSRPEVEEGSDDDVSLDADDFLDFGEDEDEENEDIAGDNEGEEVAFGEDGDEFDEEDDDGAFDGENLPKTQASDSDSEPDFFAPNSEDELSDEEMVASNKRRLDEPEGKKKKKKLSSLPVFASADDFSQYLDSEDDEY